MELYEQYTDVEYKTQRGVRSALHMSNIDPIWANVERYRHPFRKGLSLRTVRQLPYFYVQTPALQEKFEAFAKKINDFVFEYGNLAQDEEFARPIEKSLRHEILSYLMTSEGIRVSDVTLKAIVNGMYRNNESGAEVLLGYQEGLNAFMERPSPEIEEDFFVRAYEYLCRTDELTSFYRIGASNERYIGIQVGTVAEAPSEEIEDKLQELCAFIRNDPLPVALKAFVAMMGVMAIRPFAAHNEAMACLTAKQVLCNGGYGPSAFLLPLEKVMQRGESFDDYFGQTLRYADMTYFLTHAITVFSPVLENALNAMVKAKNAALQQEFNLGIAKDEPEVPVDVAPKAAPEPPSPAPVRVTPVQVEAVDKEIPLVDDSAFQGQRAVSAPRASLSDKEVKETAKYLRESHPQLSKGQCLFYASHCTMGRYYAIADYKKTIKCAYETARTSMDKLAAEGFYRKMQVKNKFVYTPIKQGEKS